MGSGKAKKARKAVFQNGASPESLPPIQRAYIEKEINKLMREFKQVTGGKQTPKAPRVFPCQRMKGKFAELKETDVPRLGDDGLWYVGEELIVSQYYKYQLHLDEVRSAQLKANTKALELEKNVKELKPEVLGDI